MRGPKTRMRLISIRRGVVGAEKLQDYARFGRYKNIKNFHKKNITCVKSEVTFVDLYYIS